MQWRKHVRIKYGGRVGVGSKRGGGGGGEGDQEEESSSQGGQQQQQPRQVQVRVVQLHQSNGTAVNYVVQPQLFAGTASLRSGNHISNNNNNLGSCIAVDMLCCGRRKVSLYFIMIHGLQRRMSFLLPLTDTGFRVKGNFLSKWFDFGPCSQCTISTLAPPCEYLGTVRFVYAGKVYWRRGQR